MHPKNFTILITFLTLSIFCKAQDGSDIKYFTPEALDSSFIGKEVHLDFYRRSYRNINIDTITIIVDNHPIRYIEHRKDNGYNNWFAQQYLEALDTINGIHTTINSWVIQKITKDSILVKPNFGLRFPKEYFIDERLFKESYWFPKDIIKEILLKSKQFGS